MDIGPDRRVAIQIPFAATVLYPWTMTGYQYERFMVERDPVAHLSKRMPNMRFVELDKTFSTECHAFSCIKYPTISRTKTRPMVNKTCIELD